MADALAKKGANLWRMPKADRERITYLKGRAWRIGLGLAAVTLDCVKQRKDDATLKPSPSSCWRESLSSMLSGLESQGHFFDNSECRMHCRICGYVGCVAINANGCQAGDLQRLLRSGGRAD